MTETLTQSKARFKECIDAIYKVCPDVILIPFHRRTVGMTAEERLQPTELFPERATWIVVPVTSETGFREYHADDERLRKENVEETTSNRRIRMFRNGTS